jgi:hypothetical protein
MKTSRFRYLVPLLVTLWGMRALATQPEAFPTPEEAAQALADAASTGSLNDALRVLGTGARPLLVSGDAVADRAALKHFSDKYAEGHQLTKRENGAEILVLGTDEWPFAIPLVHGKAGWTFDAKAGQAEILARRVGENELNVIQVCLNYVDAQREYRELNPDGDAVAHYAGRLMSSPGKHDGLYWRKEPGKAESPFGPLVSRAQQKGYTPEAGKPIAYHGYFYRMLTAQGPEADGGVLNYVESGKLSLGFALLAYPASYGNSGVMTFMVNQEGVVFQNDLGPSTLQAEKSITSFNPGEGWSRAAP